MQTVHDINAESIRLTSLLGEYSAGCDAEFDTEHEELERQFAEIRLHFGNK
jgi:hypothetical protein